MPEWKRKLIEKKKQETKAQDTTPQQTAAITNTAADVTAQQTPPPTSTIATTQQKMATFVNTGTDPAMTEAQLFYESNPWGSLGWGDPAISVMTNAGDKWYIVANGVYAKLFTIAEEAQQQFTI